MGHFIVIHLKGRDATMANYTTDYYGPFDDLVEAEDFRLGLKVDGISCTSWVIELKPRR